MLSAARYLKSGPGADDKIDDTASKLSTISSLRLDTELNVLLRVLAITGQTKEEPHPDKPHVVNRWRDIRVKHVKLAGAQIFASHDIR
ncbi:MAG: hypothetical protein AAGB07_19865 [Pseudomonadota bacterium]